MKENILPVKIALNGMIFSNRDTAFKRKKLSIYTTAKFKYPGHESVQQQVGFGAYHHRRFGY